MMRNRLGHAATAATVAIAMLALAGCGRVGNPLEVLVAKPAAPDEFQVITRKPLQMPMAVMLPEPRPGARSPLDPDPNRDAVVALMGADTRMAAAGTSAGEQALLAAANASASDPEIRATLAEDRDGRGSNEPYEPPLIWELFGLRGEAPTRDAIDPAAEARRLQTEGIAAAPIDPNDRPAVEGEVVEERSQYPEIGVGGPPRNKLPSSGPTPAF